MDSVAIGQEGDIAVELVPSTVVHYPPSESDIACRIQRSLEHSLVAAGIVVELKNRSVVGQIDRDLWVLKREVCCGLGQDHPLCCHVARRVVALVDDISVGTIPVDKHDHEAPVIGCSDIKIAFVMRRAVSVDTEAVANDISFGVEDLADNVVASLSGNPVGAGFHPGHQEVAVRQAGDLRLRSIWIVRSAGVDLKFIEPF